VAGCQSLTRGLVGSHPQGTALNPRLRQESHPGRRLRPWQHVYLWNDLETALLKPLSPPAWWSLSAPWWQVAWLRRKLGPEEGGLVAALKWVGVLTKDAATPLEAALRFKCLILVAVTLKRRSLRFSFLLSMSHR
jgi:hypothetical protein